MGKDSHDSLFSTTKIIEQRAKESTTLNRLVTEIKTEYKNNGGWSESIINKKKALESKITSIAYFHYSGNRPDGIVGLTIDEQKIFLSEFKKLLTDKPSVEVRVQGKNDDYFSSLADHDLLDGTSYRFLPKDYKERYNNHSMLMSRLTINVKKENFISLSQALMKLYEHDPNKRVMQSKIMGPKNLGKLTDQAVIYFSNANLQDAIEVSQQLRELMPEDAFLEHVPIGMYRVDKGISYSETLKGQSSSHGEARAEIIAKAVTESLLTEKPVDKCLEAQLRIYGYDVEHPALLAQSVREAYIDTSLAGGGHPSERLPSKNIEIFKQDPVSFSQQYIINTKELNAILQAPNEGKVIFTKGNSNNYVVEFIDDSYGEDQPSSIESYFLESKIRNKESKQVEYIDILIKNPDKKFLFTGLLLGDSVVVTELNSETYRVYRDNRPDASLLYDNVVMAVDERDYNNRENNTTKASLFMHYENEKWNLILQPQKGKYFAITESNVVQVQLPGDYLLPLKQQRFDIYRNKIHQDLKVAAKKFNITFSDIPNDEDLFETPSEQNTSVKTWLDIGDEIKRKLDHQITALNQSREKLEIEFSQTIDSEKRTILKNMIEMNKTIISLNKKQYSELFHDLREVEYGWLWQSVKAKKGMNAVIKINDYDTNISVNANYDYHLTVNERYDNLIYLHKVTRNLRFKSEFNLGAKQYLEVTVPGVDETMSSQQLKKLYITSEYNAKERGALYRLIQEVGHSEYISKVLTQTGKFSELFSSLGSKTNRLIPQDFYLSLMKGDSSGRCYPLVRAMSVALARNGQAGADILIDKLYIAAADPESRDALLLQSSLKNLHSNINAVESSFSHGVMELKQIQTLLEMKEETKLFALNSKKHAMLIGKIIVDGKSSYYFYDPNFGLFSFKNSKRLFSALKTFFVDKKMADYYSSFERNNKPAFELVFINTDDMESVSVGDHLTVKDLSLLEPLSIKSIKEKEIDAIIYQQDEIIHDTKLKTTLAILDAELWGERINDASINLSSEYSLNENWIPLFSSVEVIENDRYKIKFINIKDTEITRWVETSDHTFMRFHRYSMEQMGIFGKYYQFEENKIRLRNHEANSISVDGLNAGIAIQSLIQWIEEKNLDKSSVRRNAPNLFLALKIHSYVNYTMMAHGAMNDMIKINQIIKLGLNNESNISVKEISCFFSSFAKTANEGLTVIFSGALVGFDIYELSHAENDPQRIIFGTQLAFDSAGLASGVTGIGLGAMGSATAAAALGSASVIVAGLGIGFVGLARNFAIIGEDAKAVGSYFYALDQAYKGNGYDYLADKETFIPKFGAVFNTIDIKNNQIQFDSQYIYRTTPHSAGGGRKNYIFWAGNFPTMVKDKQQAINIRRGIGYQDAVHQVDFQNAKAVMLPVIPKSYIKYSYNLWPGCTSRNDSGFNVIRRLEQADNFDYDFYIFPSENTITQIFHEYVNTPIDIILDEENRELVVPQLAKEWYGKIEYKLKGNGGEYKLNLNQGIKVVLMDDIQADKPSKWIINSSLLADDTIEIKNNNLIIGGVKIEIDITCKQEKIWVINKKSEINEIDISSAQINIVSENENQWKDSTESLDSHLQHYADKHQLHGQYIVIDNHQYNGKNVGKAFYDVTNKRYIFIDTLDENKQHAILGFISKSEAYFYLPTQKSIWKVDIASGSLVTEYQLNHDIDRAFEIMQIWGGGEDLYFSCRYNDSNEVAHFRLGQDNIEILSLNAEHQRLIELAKTDPKLTQSTVRDILHDYMISGVKKENNHTNQIDSRASELLTLYGVDHNQVEHRYWLRRLDNLLIKPNLSPSLGHGEISLNPKMVQSHWSIPHDLALIGNIFDSTGNEVFYFYSAKNKELYRQVGPGQNVLDATKPTAWYMNMPFIENVIFWKGSLFVVNVDGVIGQINAQGEFHPVGLNEKWFTENPIWWSKLQDYYCCKTIALLGIRDSSGQQLIPAWYDNGKIIVASSLSTENNLQFLGLDAENMGGLIFDTVNKKLYRQSAVSEIELNSAFGQERLLLSSTALPEAVDLYPNLQFKNVKNIGHGLLLSAESGEILYVDMLEKENGENRSHIGSSLIIRGGKENDTLVPSIIKNVKQIVLNAGDCQDTYSISLDTWQHYQAIIIDNNANDLLVDTLMLPIENLDSLVVTRYDDDLLVIDNEQNTVLILRQVFGVEKQSHRHLKLHFINHPNSISIEQFIDRYTSVSEIKPAQYIYNHQNIESDSHMRLISEHMAALDSRDSLTMPRMDTHLVPNMMLGNNASNQNFTR